VRGGEKEKKKEKKKKKKKKNVGKYSQQLIDRLIYNYKANYAIY
jgi:hypothetical protein